MDNLNEFCINKVIKRFPSGRHASYMLGNETLDIDVVKRQLKAISEGHDSDHRYTDEQSKKDALKLLIELEKTFK